MHEERNGGEDTESDGDEERHEPAHRLGRALMPRTSKKQATGRMKGGYVNTASPSAAPAMDKERRVPPHSQASPRKHPAVKKPEENVL